MSCIIILDKDKPFQEICVMKKIKRIHIGLLIGLFLFLIFSFQTTADEKKLSKVLNVYNWEEYFGETTIADFEKKFGVKVNL